SDQCSAEAVKPAEESVAPERLRRAETVLAHRTSRLLLVLEQCMDSHNHQAVLRTAEALGVQNVWLINANERQVKKHKSGTKKITKNCSVWLTIREFTSIVDCIEALRTDGRTIWATDLAPEAMRMTLADKPTELPEKLAIVIGREIDGVSQEMLDAADKRIYFPIFGFTESLNLSVATALVLQRMFDWFPDIRGDLTDEEKETIRAQWYPQIVSNPTQRAQAAHWLEHTEEIEPLADLRREKLAWNDKWVPKSVKRRELEMPQVQERSNRNDDGNDDKKDKDGKDETHKRETVDE
ncbi:TPA: hypothetical protein N0F65_012787, partial [Lagenidium giganteum]